MAQTVPLMCAAAAGAVLVVQGELLADISKTNGLLGAVLTNAMVGCTLLFLFALITSPELFANIGRNFRWWHFAPGLLGTIFVYATVVAYARLGPMAAAAIVIAAQLLAACVAEAAGLAAVSHPMSLFRLAGIAVVMVGAVFALPR